MTDFKFIDIGTTKAKILRVLKADANTLTELPKISGELVTTGNIRDILNLGSSVGGSDILKPGIDHINITNPFEDWIYIGLYKTSETFIGEHTRTEWQVSLVSDFSSLVETSDEAIHKLKFMPRIDTPNTTVYVRYRLISGDIASPWSDTITFITGNGGIRTPVLITKHEDAGFTVTGGIFSSYGVGSFTHTKTEFKVYDKSGTELYTTTVDSGDLTKTVIPTGIVSGTSNFYITARYIGTVGGKEVMSRVGWLSVSQNRPYVDPPVITVIDSVASVSRPKIYNSANTHTSTTWKVLNSTGATIYTSENNPAHKLSVDLTDVLEPNMTYIISARYVAGDLVSAISEYKFVTDSYKVKPLTITVENIDSNKIRVNYSGYTVRGDVDSIRTIQLMIGEEYRYYTPESLNAEYNKPFYIEVDLTEDLIKKAMVKPGVTGTGDDKVPNINLDKNSNNYGQIQLYISGHIIGAKHTVLSKPVLHKFMPYIDISGINLRYEIAHGLVSKVITNKLPTIVNPSNWYKMSVRGLLSKQEITATSGVSGVITNNNDLICVFDKYLEHNVPGETAFDTSLLNRLYNIDPSGITNTTLYGSLLIQTNFTNSNSLDVEDNGEWSVVSENDTNIFITTNSVSIPVTDPDVEFITETTATSNKKLIVNKSDSTHWSFLVGDYGAVSKSTPNNPLSFIPVTDEYYGNKEDNRNILDKHTILKPEINATGGKTKVRHAVWVDVVRRIVKTNDDTENKQSILSYGNKVSNYTNTWIWNTTVDGPSIRKESISGLGIKVPEHLYSVHMIQFYRYLPSAKTLEYDFLTDTKNITFNVFGVSKAVSKRIFDSTATISSSVTIDTTIPISYGSGLGQFSYDIVTIVVGDTKEAKLRSLVRNLSGDIYGMDVVQYFYVPSKLVFDSLTGPEGFPSNAVNITTVPSSLVTTSNENGGLTFKLKATLGDMIKHNPNFLRDNDIDSVCKWHTVGDFKKAFVLMYVRAKYNGNAVITNTINNYDYKVIKEGLNHMGISKVHGFTYNHNSNDVIWVDNLNTKKSVSGLPSHLQSAEFYGKVDKAEWIHYVDPIWNENGLNSGDYVRVPFGFRAYKGEWGCPTNLLRQRCIYTDQEQALLDTLTEEADLITETSTKKNALNLLHIPYRKGDRVSYKGDLYEAKVDQGWADHIPTEIEYWHRIFVDWKLPTNAELLGLLGLHPGGMTSPTIFGKEQAESNHIVPFFTEHYDFKDFVNNENVTLTHKDILYDLYGLEKDTTYSDDQATLANNWKTGYYKIKSPTTQKTCYIMSIPTMLNVSYNDIYSRIPELFEIDRYTVKIGTRLYHVRVPSAAEMEFLNIASNQHAEIDFKYYFNNTKDSLYTTDVTNYETFPGKVTEVTEGVRNLFWNDPKNKITIPNGDHNLETYLFHGVNILNKDTKAKKVCLNIFTLGQPVDASDANNVKPDCAVYSIRKSGNKIDHTNRVVSSRTGLILVLTPISECNAPYSKKDLLKRYPSLVYPTGNDNFGTVEEPILYDKFTDTGFFGKVPVSKLGFNYKSLATSLGLVPPTHKLDDGNGNGNGISVKNMLMYYYHGNVIYVPEYGPYMYKISNDVDNPLRHSYYYRSNYNKDTASGLYASLTDNFYKNGNTGTLEKYGLYGDKSFTISFGNMKYDVGIMSGLGIVKPCRDKTPGATKESKNDMLKVLDAHCYNITQKFYSEGYDKELMCYNYNNKYWLMSPVVNNSYIDLILKSIGYQGVADKYTSDTLTGEYTEDVAYQVKKPSTTLGLLKTDISGAVLRGMPYEIFNSPGNGNNRMLTAITKESDLKVLRTLERGPLLNDNFSRFVKKEYKSDNFSILDDKDNRVNSSSIYVNSPFTVPNNKVSTELEWKGVIPYTKLSTTSDNLLGYANAGSDLVNGEVKDIDRNNGANFQPMLKVIPDLKPIGSIGFKQTNPFPGSDYTDSSWNERNIRLQENEGLLTFTAGSIPGDHNIGVINNRKITEPIHKVMMIIGNMGENYNSDQSAILPLTVGKQQDYRKSRFKYDVANDYTQPKNNIINSIYSISNNSSSDVKTVARSIVNDLVADHMQTGSIMSPNILAISNDIANTPSDLTNFTVRKSDWTTGQFNLTANAKRIVTVVALYMYQLDGKWYYWYMMDYMGIVSVKEPFKITTFSITPSTDKTTYINVNTVTKVNYFSVPNGGIVNGYQHAKTTYKLYKTDKNSASNGTLVETKEYNLDTTANLANSSNHRFNIDNKIPVGHYYYVTAEIVFIKDYYTKETKVASTSVFQKLNNDQLIISLTDRTDYSGAVDVRAEFLINGERYNTAKHQHVLTRYTLYKNNSIINTKEIDYDPQQPPYTASQYGYPATVEEGDELYVECYTVIKIKSTGNTIDRTELTPTFVITTPMQLDIVDQFFASAHWTDDRHITANISGKCYPRVVNPESSEYKRYFMPNDIRSATVEGRAYLLIRYNNGQTEQVELWSTGGTISTSTSGISSAELDIPDTQKSVFTDYPRSMAQSVSVYVTGEFNFTGDSNRRAEKDISISHTV